ncbi:hypothetical protein MRB53_029688 [Persea americana]|uniref:Uncharacterized protein n=1 Tax=Persea americana TaxID=3435 RepID=A0ACC2KJ42_PERAE|nr:hypothetical protein MRB53_029688 [Persea americana]
MIQSELHSQLNDHIVSNEDNTCYLCGKKFFSDKGLCGHMRLHPNRGWKGIRPPTIADNLYVATQEVTHENMSNQSGEKLEVEDGKFKPKRVTNKMDSTSEKKQIGDKKEDIKNIKDDKPIMQSINRKRKKKTMRAILGKDSDDHYNNNEKKSMVGKKFICVTCKKSFLTHQALGGHRTGHKKDKIENDPHGATAPLLETNEGRIEKPHQCKLCDKVFPTGQALGGHQRCHRASPIDDIGSSVTSSKDTRKMDRKQPLNFDLNEPPQGYQEDGLQATSEPPLVD